MIHVTMKNGSVNHHDLTPSGFFGLMYKGQFNYSPHQIRKIEFEDATPISRKLLEKRVEDAIIKHVIETAKYLDPPLDKYVVYYDGKQYTAKDTRDLVVQICKDHGIPCKK